MRKQLGTLRQLTVQPTTRLRYNQAKDDFFEYLKSINRALPSTAKELDIVVSDYLEHLWAIGSGRSAGSNSLAALQDSQPYLKGKLAQSWRLMKTWVINEIPNRAPPLTLEMVEAMTGYALFKGLDTFALSLLLGFFGLLRTGEILSITAAQVSIHDPKGPAVLSLGMTKAGKRQGAAESVTLHVEDVCRRLYHWKTHVSSRALLAPSGHKWRKTFNEVLSALSFDKADYRPYSLRRGGATHFFSHLGSFDKLLQLGRWQAAKTARIYVNEGLAVLAEMNTGLNPFAKNLRTQYLRCLTQPLPRLARAQDVQVRGSWKQHHKKQKRKRTGENICVWPPVSRAWPDQGGP